MVLGKTGIGMGGDDRGYFVDVCSAVHVVDNLKHSLTLELLCY